MLIFGVNLLLYPVAPLWPQIRPVSATEQALCGYTYLACIGDVSQGLPEGCPLILWCSPHMRSDCRTGWNMQLQLSLLVLIPLTTCPAELPVVFESCDCMWNHQVTISR